MKTKFVFLFVIFFLSVTHIIYGQASEKTELEVTVKNEGWKLIGDLMLPDSKGVFPAVLMLNKANGDRQVYESLANHLADRGIASLRMDLRGHGGSTNIEKFIPYEKNPNPLIGDAEKDVIAAINFLKTHPRINSNKIAALGASYSGEEVAEAGRKSGYVQAYVVLSPGSFSDESIEGIDSSNVPWLFVVSKREKYLQEITKSVQEKSEHVEIIIFPGTEHASRILTSEKDLAERIAVWLAAQF